MLDRRGSNIFLLPLMKFRQFITKHSITATLGWVMDPFTLIHSQKPFHIMTKFFKSAQVDYLYKVKTNIFQQWFLFSSLQFSTVNLSFWLFTVMYFSIVKEGVMLPIFQPLTSVSLIPALCWLHSADSTSKSCTRILNYFVIKPVLEINL